MIIKLTYPIGIFGNIDFTVRVENNALILKQLTLNILAAESKGFRGFTKAINDAVARDYAGFGVDVEGIADDPRKVRIARKHRDLSVSSDFSTRNQLNLFVNKFKSVQFYSPFSKITNDSLEKYGANA